MYCTANYCVILVSTTAAGSGVFVGLLGVAYYAEIHHIAYFIVVQIFVGVFEVSVPWFLGCSML